MRRPGVIDLLLGFVLIAAGCGYQFRVEGLGPTIGGGSTDAAAAPAPRVVIPTCLNNSTEPNLELKYAGYARREFSAGSGARVVSEMEQADYILKCIIGGVSIPTINFSLQGTFESRVTVNMSVTAEEVKTGKKIWTQTASASSEFFMTDDLQFNRQLQTRALEQAGRFLAADLATRFQDFLDRRAKAASVPAPAAPPSPPPSPSGNGSPAK